MDQEKRLYSRRKFLGTSSAALAGISILPSKVIAGMGHQAPSDKLNIAGIGVGGVGFNNLSNMSSENIVALCDVDWDFANKSSFKAWALAKKYKDYRKLFDQQKDIDAVMIATPDHSHALPAMIAMQLGYHVYLQAPLAHSVYESQRLAQTAKVYGVATQMGNQGNSGEGIRKLTEWIQSGVIGPVKKVDAWTNQPHWKQPKMRLKDNLRIPAKLDWNLFIGTAPYRPYEPNYHPWSWRAWWDFGNSTIGTMGCHILDPVFMALKLESPNSVEASSSPVWEESGPASSHIIFKFPSRDNLPHQAMPELTLNWYAGGIQPNRPSELKDGESMGDETGGCIFYGSKGIIMCDSYGNNPTLLPKSEMNHFSQPAPFIRRIPNAKTNGHEQDWIRACKEQKQYRVNTVSNFNYASKLSETVLLGAIAIRSQSLNRPLKWDSSQGRFTNISESDQLSLIKEEHFSIEDGLPHYHIDSHKTGALPMIESWLHPNYRTGWQQL